VPNPVQSKEVEVLAVHSSSLASGLAFVSEAASGDLSGVESGVVAFVCTSEVVHAGTSEDAGILVAVDEH